MNKFLIFAIVAVVVVLGIAFKMNGDSKAKAELIAKQKVEYEEKLKLDKAVSELQSKYEMSDSDARQIITSTKIDKQTQQFYQDISKEWSDAIQIASATPRISLAQPVKQLQDIRNKLDKKSTSTFCENKMKGDLLLAYDYSIDAFLDFMKKYEYSSDANAKMSVEKMNNSLILIDYC